MKILLINNYFPPEIGAASHLYFSLGKELAKRGHEVFVITGIPRYNISKEIYEKYLNEFKPIEKIDKINVIRIKLPFIERKRRIRRGFEHFEVAYKMKKRSLKYLDSIDVALVYSPPITLSWTAKELKKKFHFPFILNVQDLFPQSVIDLGMMNNSLIISFFKKLEKKSYLWADLITVHSQKNLEHVAKILGNQTKVSVIENWIDVEEVTPGEKENEFSEKHDLGNDFIVSFAGTLGFSQDLDVILEAAKITEGKPIKYIIVGNGVQLEHVKSKVNELNLDNVKLIPPVSKEEYPYVLQSSDVSLATLKKEVRTPTVPSKIMSIMSAGIPLIACVNMDGDVPEIIKRAQSGFALQAGDAKGLAEKILVLYRNPDLREKLGSNGRNYVEKKLSVEIAAEKYENLFKRIIECY